MYFISYEFLLNALTPEGKRYVLVYNKFTNDTYVVCHNLSSAVSDVFFAKLIRCLQYHPAAAGLNWRELHGDCIALVVLVSFFL